MKPDGVARHDFRGQLVLSLVGRRCAFAVMGQVAVAAVVTAAAIAHLDRPLLAVALLALAAALSARALRPLFSYERVVLSCDDVVVRSWWFGRPRVRRACLTEVGLFEPDIFGVAGPLRIGAGLDLDADARRFVAAELNRRLGALRGWR